MVTVNFDEEVGMYKALSPGAVHIRLPWEECLPLAKRHGFEGIEVSVDGEHAAGYYRDKLGEHGLRASGIALPVDFRGEEGKYRSGLERLRKIAASAREIGMTRFFMWIIPCSDTLNYHENFAFHVQRLGAAAEILAGEGCRLGLEFLGPRTIRVGHRYTFVRTLEQMVELCGAVGGNCGVLLDSWHWYTSLGTCEEIRALSAEQVVYVHVNDAPAGVAVEAQVDASRKLPGATGVVDIGGFVGALQGIGYDGPVVAEPFDAGLKGLTAEEAAGATAGALRKVLGGGE